MNNKIKIEGTDDAWDNGDLGRSEEFVGIDTEDFEASLDDALELQMISIRLDKSLIEDFRNIAAMRGLGYQPLMRQILKRFADSEKKALLREAADKTRKQAEQKKQVERKVA